MYLPVLLAAFVCILKYKQIQPLWFLVLVLSLVTGTGPIAALIFLAAHRRMLNQREVNTEAPVQPAMTDQATQSPYIDTSIDKTSQSYKKYGTALGTIVTVVLWISGLAVVGFFVLITVVFIQCANQPKCI
jgi:hypothetical protein